MVFASAKQRRAFFATGNFKRAPMQPGFTDSVAFSYRDGRRLGRFKNLNEVFKRFPGEKKAFQLAVSHRRKMIRQTYGLSALRRLDEGKNGDA